MTPSNKQTLIDRLLKRTEVQPNGCWHWMGATLGKGYGQIWDGRRRVLTHRLSHELFIAPIPEGVCVCHKCDNPKCINPDHLFLGTQKVNLADMANKGRSTHGERNRMSKLTEASVASIREMYAAGGVTKTKLAQLFGVTTSLVSCITLGKVWKRSLEGNNQ